MNILKINGTAISGIYVDAAVSFNKPAKRVQSISVPGRNGNLIIDEGAFDNVLISYPVFEKNSFPMEFDSIVNWLSSLEGYQRIECSNDPTHFRLGRFVVPQTPTSKRLNRDGYYQLSFDCKPQRYLNLGEVPTEIDANPSETYGPADIVSFEAAQEDTISGAEFSIVPQQDLHGYDNPWPAGGRGNLCDPSTKTKQGTTQFRWYVADGYLLKANQAYTISTNKQNGVVYFYDKASGTSIQSGNVSCTYTPTEDTTVFFAYYLSGGVADDTELQLEKGSTATAFAPYSNICPISGFTGAEITAKGTNLLSGYGVNVPVHIPSGTQFTASCKDGGLYTYAYFYDIQGNEITYYSINNIDGITGRKYRTFNLPYDIYYIKFGNTNQGDNQVALGTEIEYHASVGATHDITWQDEAGTVYGGSIAYLGGDAWRLTKTMESVDMGDLTWTYISGVFVSDGNALVKVNVKNALCSAYSFNGDANATSASAISANLSNGEICSYSNATNAGRFVVKDANYTDAAIFKTAMTGQTICYELATPVVYDLTGEELARIVGQNNIFANCGQSTVVITEPTYFVNPGYFTSKPIIRVYGDGTFRVGDNIITIAAHTQPYIDIDSELQDCYCGDTNMNEYVTFTSGEYPVLVPGSNYVLMGEGITKLIITPNWWEL